MIETINKLVRTQRALIQELGREPSSEEVAKRMDIPVYKVRKVMEIAQEPISLETPIGEEESRFSVTGTSFTPGYRGRLQFRGRLATTQRSTRSAR